MNIKDMKFATGHGKNVAYFTLEVPEYVPGENPPGQSRMIIENCKLVEGKNGLFVGMPQQAYTQAGVKKYKDIIHLQWEQQNRVNAAAIKEYRRLVGAPAAPAPEPEDQIPW